MSRYLVFIVLVFCLVSCKAKKIISDTKPIVVDTIKTETGTTTAQIIQKQVHTKMDFSTLYLRSSIKYKDDKQSQNISAEIKIKKDEKILISIRFLGITMAKGLITPTSVQYYEKINGTYFDGDYRSLSQWLGTDLDFNKIQNMLLGQPIDDLSKSNYKIVETSTSYQLSTLESKTEKTFLIDKSQLALIKQLVNQPEQERKMEIDYNNFQNYANGLLPMSLFINAQQTKGKTEISMEYNSPTYNEELTFPYSVPDGYERIFIN